MLLKRINSFCNRLRRDEGGNALMLMALGMPVLIGSSGLAVDVAQWYVWKRELQYAVDQSALAGAWASAEPEAADSYEELAELEYFDNLSILTDDASDPAVSKEDYDTGTDNSVVVTASTSRSLPFTKMLWDGEATINVRAQASFQAATNYTTCLLALDPDDPSSFVLGGSANGTVTCGMGALSVSDTAMVKNGNPNITVNDLISAGGIDDGLAVNGTIHEYVSNLSDPYDDLVPPASPTSQTYDCGSKNSSGSAKADIKATTAISYTYWQGKNKNSATQITYTGTGAQTGSSSFTWSYDQTVSDTKTEGLTETISTTDAWTGNQWNTSVKNTYIYEKKTTTVSNTYSNVAVITTGNSGNAHNLQPGTYSSISVTCDTFFNPGVYYITGTFDLGQNKSVSGADVLFVMTGSGSEKFKLNSKSEVNFSGITAATLQSQYGMSEADAEALQGMIVFDKVSTASVQINGGADVIFEGIFYAPYREAKFNGNSSMNGKCMMLAVGKITFTGNNDFSSFCIPPDTSAFDVGGTTISVRLVA